MTGRYPMHLGMYLNNGLMEGVDLGYTLLPGLLKSADWSTHALGKWHVGWFNTSYIPTSRGFDTFLGSSGNYDDYWNHTISGPARSCNGVDVWYDFVNCTDGCGGPKNLPDSSSFGEYDARV